VLDDAVIERVRSQGLDPEGGIHGLEHALIGLMPLYAMCDRQDIGGSSCSLHPHTGGATIFIYDAHVGGVGIAEAAYARTGELLQSTLRVLEECACQDGCPSCVQSPKCGSNNAPLDKQAALVIARSLVG
jgi:DEAD/DEAH box helicase domain-containing protein